LNPDKETMTGREVRQALESTLGSLLPEEARMSVMSYLEKKYKLLSRREPPVTIVEVELGLLGFFGSPARIFIAEVVRRYLEIIEQKQRGMRPERMAATSAVT
jgi:hypothetical protein